MRDDELIIGLSREERDLLRGLMLRHIHELAAYEIESSVHDQELINSILRRIQE